MKIFTTLALGQGALMRVWCRSWESRGWETRLRSDKAERGRDVKVNIINFSFKPGQRWPRVVKFGRPGWKLAALVRFDTEDQVLNCGRPL